MQSSSKNLNPPLHHRVVIVDDHAIVRAMLHQLLEYDFSCSLIEEADSAEQLISICVEKTPNLVILDLSMPGMGGFEALRRLKLKRPDLKVIIFSAFQNPCQAKQTLKAGANGYISKSSSIDVISAGISEVMKGITFVSPDIRDRMADEIQQTAPGLLEKLSIKEMIIFRKLAIGLSIGQISKDLFLSKKTIGNNASIIKKKLGISSTAEIVHIAVNEDLLDLNFIAGNVY